MGILSICRPEQLPENLVLDAPGGFAWWYCDLIDAKGDGIVLIAFLGLPFLPGYQLDRERPVDHPGLNFVVYRDGKPAFYLLQEYGHAETVLQPTAWTWQFGASHLALEWRDSNVTLTGTLDLEVPGTHERCKVSLRVQGPESRIAPAHGDPRHVWCPIAPSAEGRVELACGDEAPWSVVGRAYVDANASRVPLGELGLASWQWGRLAFPERELVYYAMTPEGGAAEQPLVLSVPHGGAAARNDVTDLVWEEKRRNFYGLSFHERTTLHDPDGNAVDVTVKHVVEEGPFYLRFLLEAHCAATGERGRGFAELVDVARIDREWQRPFVRMRTHQARGPNSMWIPLFSGPRSGRAMRLLRHWFGSASARGAQA